MKRGALVACLWLAGCGTPQEGALAGISPGKAITSASRGVSQAPAMEAQGLKAYPWDEQGMQTLIPCRRLRGRCPLCYHQRLSLKERLKELERTEGAFLADCGKLNDKYVWGR